MHIEQIRDNNLYTLNIEDGKYMNENLCSWYYTTSQHNMEAEKIGTGASCTTRLNKACRIFAVYEDRNTGVQIISQSLSIEPEFNAPTILYILIAVGVGVVGIIGVILVISKKRYKKYY